MLPASATETNRQMRFTLGQMRRKQHQQKPRNPINEFGKSGIGVDMAGNLGIAPILLS
jgi:hypothetical protein